MKKFLLKSIRFYQKFLSFDSGLLKIVLPSNSTCKFYPSCSEYFYQAVNKYGILHGSRLGFTRISRCHPGSVGGPDPLI